MPISNNLFDFTWSLPGIVPVCFPITQPDRDRHKDALHSPHGEFPNSDVKQRASNGTDKPLQGSDFLLRFFAA